MVCCCSSPQCAKYGCQSWAKIEPPVNFVGYSHPVQTGVKPHKCPVCDGSGIVLTEAAKVDFDGMLKADLDTHKKCKSCVNGIVWG